ncbi:MAG: hypothetical protein M9887_05750 [Chitinophagales bacterium]|nr:hypothetical protein [Chitinophagales bacterium]
MRLKMFNVLIFLFVCTLLIRLPNLNRPISKHHEFNTAFFLIPMDVWDNDGIFKHGFLPSYNYSNPSDKEIGHPIGIPNGNKDGDYYYLSLPSFSYVLPYLLFKLFFIPIAPLSLQVFNLIIHFLTIVMLFRLLKMCFDEKSALIGSLVFLFSPVLMWFFGNGYTHHVLGTALFVAVVYFLFLYLNIHKKYALYLFGFIFCLLLLTEWIGVLLGATIFLLFVLKLKEDKYRKILFTLIISGLPVLLIFYYQYVVFIGLDNYIAYQANRLNVRSTLANHSFTLFHQFWGLMKWYIVGYGVWLVMILGLLGLYLAKKDKFKISIYQKYLFILSILPVWMYHFLFMEFTLAHDYSVLYDGLLLSFLVTFLTYYTFRDLQTTNGKVLASLLVIVCLSVGHYYYINRPGKISRNGDAYSIYKDIGEEVKATIADDGMVFMKRSGESSSDPCNPQIVYYAKRSIKPVSSEEEAFAFMKEFHQYKGKLYIQDGAKVTKIIDLYLENH